MGAQLNRCTAIFPPHPIINCHPTIPHRPCGRPYTNTPRIRYSGLQRINTNGWFKRRRTQVCFAMLYATHAPTKSSVAYSFSNYTLKFVDASFYQVARGLVLPLTVATSYVMLHARPSLRILFSCSIVTLGFFVGVFLDAIPISLVGVFFSVSHPLASQQCTRS